MPEMVGPAFDEDPNAPRKFPSLGGAENVSPETSASPPMETNASETSAGLPNGLTTPAKEPEPSPTLAEMLSTPTISEPTIPKPAEIALPGELPTTTADTSRSPPTVESSSKPSKANRLRIPQPPIPLHR